MKECMFCDGEMIYDRSEKAYICSSCNARAYKEDGELVFEDEDSEWDDIFGNDVGCMACGNDQYPKCIDSCPMYDN